jgi:4'-phosphopantetheinyl transferase
VALWAALHLKLTLLKSQTNKEKPIATVWLVDSCTVSDHDLVRHFDWLNADEVARYQKFIRPERQRQFLIGRILLRLALADLLQIDPVSIGLSERAGNSPVLMWPAPAPRFSLSHSGSWVACAISSDTVLGLDIEVLDNSRDLVALSEHAFGLAEQNWIKSLPEIERAGAFYQLWSQKEAIFKLRSNSADGIAPVSHCAILPHSMLSVVLASAHPWAVMPEIKQVYLEIGLPPVLVLAD